MQQLDESAPVTVVTGASSGVGRATALRLAALGHHVYATVRTASAAADLRSEARSSLDGAFLQPMVLDLTDDAGVQEQIEELTSSRGRIDNLISNAGIYIGGAVENIPIEDFARALDTNFLGAMRIVKAILPTMRARRRGRIVAISSQSGQYVLPTGGAYSASKAALEAAIEALALEVARYGVEVTVVQLGLVQTKIHDNATRHAATPPYIATYKRALAVGLADAPLQLQPGEVAEAIASILSSPFAPRVVIGTDARRNLARRAALTDAEYIALHAIDDDSEFTQAWRSTFGFEIDL